MTTKEKEAELPIDALKRRMVALEEQVSGLKAELDKSEKRWKSIQDFLAKFGAYYNVEGNYAGMFILHQILNGTKDQGVLAYGVALSPRQGLIDDLMLPIRLKQEKGEPCMIPVSIPDKTEELLENFDAEPMAVGANT